MQLETIKNLEQYTKRNRRRSIWRKIVRFLACVVVFCTTYALILPALTMEQPTFCNYEEHVHSEDCYVQQPVSVNLICSPEAHVHNELCFDEFGGLVCGMADYIAHTHSADCYSTDGSVICSLAETVWHVHNESCLVPAKPNVICGLFEGELHFHDDTCYIINVTVNNNQLVFEDTAHVHSTVCYDELGNLICGLEETPVHTHGNECFDELGTLICLLPETPVTDNSGFSVTEERILNCTMIEGDGHYHTEQCYEMPENAFVLGCDPESVAHIHNEFCVDEFGGIVCGLSENIAHIHDINYCYDINGNLVCKFLQTMEHVHSADCFAQNEQPLTCMLEENEEHTHSDLCYGTWEFVCVSEEHEHDLACFSDPEADLETAEDWEMTLENLSLSGIWADDVVTVAESQIGYAESELNYAVSDDGVTALGYTRYGQWFGTPYEDWSASFASFCLHYANVEGMSFNNNCAAWVNELSAGWQDLYRTAYEYEPKKGDLVFFDTDGDVVADRVGIVAEVIPATEFEPAALLTVEGDCDNMVQYMVYDLDDTSILGYGMLSEQEAEVYTYNYFDGYVDVSVEIPADSGIPSNAILSVTPIDFTDSNYFTLLSQAEAAVDGEVSKINFYDISFYTPEYEYIPVSESAKVTMHFSDSVIKPDVDSTVVLHYGSDGGAPTVLEDVTIKEEVVISATTFSLRSSVIESAETVLTFETDGFSVFAVIEVKSDVPAGTRVDVYDNSTGLSVDNWAGFGEGLSSFGNYFDTFSNYTLEDIKELVVHGGVTFSMIYEQSGDGIPQAQFNAWDMPIYENGNPVMKEVTDDKTGVTSQVNDTAECELDMTVTQLSSGRYLATVELDDLFDIFTSGKFGEKTVDNINNFVIQSLSENFKLYRAWFDVPEICDNVKSGVEKDIDINDKVVTGNNFHLYELPSVVNVETGADKSSNNTVVLHLKGETDAAFRVFLSGSSGVNDAASATDTPIEVIGSFDDLLIEIVGNDLQVNNHGEATHIQIKGENAGDPLPNITFDHIGVFYGTMENYEAAINNTTPDDDTPEELPERVQLFESDSDEGTLIEWRPVFGEGDVRFVTEHDDQGNVTGTESINGLNTFNISLDTLIKYAQQDGVTLHFTYTHSDSNSSAEDGNTAWADPCAAFNKIDTGNTTYIFVEATSIEDSFGVRHAYVSLTDVLKHYTNANGSIDGITGFGIYGNAPGFKLHEVWLESVDEFIIEEVKEIPDDPDQIFELENSITDKGDENNTTLTVPVSSGIKLNGWTAVLTRYKAEAQMKDLIDSLQTPGAKLKITYAGDKEPGVVLQSNQNWGLDTNYTKCEIERVSGTDYRTAIFDANALIDNYLSSSFTTENNETVYLDLESLTNFSFTGNSNVVYKIEVIVPKSEVKPVTNLDGQIAAIVAVNNNGTIHPAIASSSSGNGNDLVGSDLEEFSFDANGKPVIRDDDAAYDSNGSLSGGNRIAWEFEAVEGVPGSYYIKAVNVYHDNNVVNPNAGKYMNISSGRLSLSETPQAIEVVMYKTPDIKAEIEDVVCLRVKDSENYHYVNLINNEGSDNFCSGNLNEDNRASHLVLVDIEDNDVKKLRQLIDSLPTIEEYDAEIAKVLESNLDSVYTEFSTYATNMRQLAIEAKQLYDKLVADYSGNLNELTLKKNFVGYDRLEKLLTELEWLWREAPEVVNPVTLNATVKLFNYTDKINDQKFEAAEGTSDTKNLYYSFYNWSIGGRDVKVTPYDNAGERPVMSPVLDANGYPVILQLPSTETDDNGIVYIPVTNSSLDYLFKEDSPYYKGTMTDGGGLFRQDSEGYYYFYSDTNAAVYDEDANRFVLYDVAYRPGYMHDEEDSKLTPDDRSNFLPFNDINNIIYDHTDDGKGVVEVDSSIGENGKIETAYIADAVDMWFGMDIEFDFFIPSGAKVNGQDLEFDFHGDDDVFVYIDDVLVLDIGGCHVALDGKINFATGRVEYQTSVDTTVITTLGKIFKAAGKDDTYMEANFEKDADGNYTTFKDFSTHKLKFFYLERGGSKSYCGIRFNLPSIPAYDLMVGKELYSLKEKDGSYEEVEIESNDNFYFRVVNAEDPTKSFLPAFTRFEIYEDGTYISNGLVNSDGIFTLKAGQIAVFPTLSGAETGGSEYIVQELLPADVAEMYGIIEYRTDGSMNDTLKNTIGVQTQSTSLYNTLMFSARAGESDDTHVHNYNAWQYFDGDQHSQRCQDSNCNYEEKNPHIWEEESRTEATCTQDGRIKLHCKDCDYNTDKIIPAKGTHEFKWVFESEQGHRGSCSLCNLSQYGQHDFVNNICIYCSYNQSTDSIEGGSGGDTNCNGNHTVTDWDKDVSTHNGICSNCHQPVAGNHEFGAWENYDYHNHKRSCNICGYEDFGKHDTVYNKIDDNQHSASCNTCGGSINEKHKFTGETCEGCGYQKPTQGGGTGIDKGKHVGDNIVYQTETLTLESGEENSASIVAFKNVMTAETGTLKITKVGAGNGETFNMQVLVGSDTTSRAALTPLTAGTPYTINDQQFNVGANGIIPLKVGETAIIEGFAPGTFVEVFEVLTGEQVNKYTASYDGEIEVDKSNGGSEIRGNGTAIIGEGDTVHITVTNAQNHDQVIIPITKTVTNMRGSAATFNFKVEKGTWDANSQTWNKDSDIDGTSITFGHNLWGNPSITTGTDTNPNIVLGYTLQDLQDKDGTYQYKIYEQNTGGNYIYDDTFYIVTVKVSGGDADIDSILKNGTEPYGESNDDTATPLAFVNQPGIKLTVTKQVVGSDTSGEFTFTLYANNPKHTEVIQPNKNVDFTRGENGTITFTLKHGESIEFMIPLWANIYLEEIDTGGSSVSYTVIKNNEISRTNGAKLDNYHVGETDVIVNYTNVRGFELPKTGGPGIYLYASGGILLLAIFAVLLYNKTKCGKEDHASS